MQNLVSASLAEATKQEILQKFQEIKERLNFLLTLQPEEVRGLLKVGNNYAPFLEKAYHVTETHPEILPQVFNLVEFKQDYLLSKDLSMIYDQSHQLNDGIEKTMYATNSDAMAGALEVYSAVKQHRDKVAGLNVIAEEMGEFFKKPRKKTE